jgi:hypothetical protein
VIWSCIEDCVCVYVYQVLIRVSYVYYHVSGVPWLMITCSGLDDWICWSLILQSLLITINYNNSQSSYYWRFAPFSSSCLNSLTTSELNYWTELSQRSHMSSLYNFGKNLIEFTTSTSSSIITCLSVAAETCLANRYPATDVLLLLRA